VLLIVVGLLGAALAAAVATIYYGDSRRPAATATPKVIDKGSSPSPVTANKVKQSAPAKPAQVHASANENEEARAKVLAANAAGRRAIVTSLNPLPNAGTVTIRSSKPATVYLYPSKRIIGTTPIIDLQLPDGTYKFKAQVGEGQRKYFHLKVESGKSAARSFNHWKR
jgi:hypothetical protein